MAELKERVENKIKKNFVIQYYDTEQNKAVIKTLLLMCKEETDNNWLQGIKKLLEYYSNDWKTQVLMNELQQLRERITNIETNNIPKQSQEKTRDRTIKTFGKTEE